MGSFFCHAFSANKRPEDMLAHPQLPPGLIERCLDIMKEIMPSERDLIRVVVEIVVELRDGEPDEQNDEPPVGVSSYFFPC